MLHILKKIFNPAPNVNFKKILGEGAIILDVRTPAEFDSGHIKEAINIPLHSLDKKRLDQAKKDKPIITCCASGIRSAAAKNTLKDWGFTQVYNGGSWRSLQHKLE